MDDQHADDQTMSAAIISATSALSGPDRVLAADDLEVAVLSRRNGRRCFMRLTDTDVAAALAG
jgi:proteasome alpha subunit